MWIVSSLEDRSLVYEGIIMYMHIVTSRTRTGEDIVQLDLKVISKRANALRATYKGQLQGPDSSSPDFDFHHLLGSA